MSALYTWGTSYREALGISGVNTTNIPLLVVTSEDFVKISTGSSIHTSVGAVLAIASDGTLWGWGNAAATYQLGTGSGYGAQDIETPTQIGSNTWLDISVGERSTLGVKTDGTLWTWGSDYTYGILGQGTSNSVYYVPTQIGSGTDWAKVFAFSSRSFAIKTDGTLWACGRNNVGQLGIGSIVDTYTFTQVGTDQWIDLSSCVALSVYGIKADGTLWTWGSGGVTSGVNSTPGTYETSPVSLTTGSSWTRIFSHHSGGYALNAAGELYGWGYNGQYQLGLGDTTTRPLPTLLATGPWSIVSGGAASSVQNHAVMGIKTDGTLWAWGTLTYPTDPGAGILGLGAVNQAQVPTQIGSLLWSDVSVGGDTVSGIQGTSSTRFWTNVVGQYET